MLIHPELRKAHEKSTDVSPYYIKRAKYLKKHGFFAKTRLVKFGTVNESMVKDSIVQTSQILFEVTDSCNLNCTYCGYGEVYEVFDKRDNNNINVDYAKKFLRYMYDLKLRNNKTKLMIGFYGGEPLLNVGFIKQIVEFANGLKVEKDMNIEYSMTTNATLIHKYIDFLTENKFDLLISIDGNEENHSYRVFGKNNKNSFLKVIRNIDMIQRDYSDYFIDHVNFNAVLHNKNSVKEIYDFIHTRYHKIPEISPLTLRDVKPDKKDFFEEIYHNQRKSEAEYQKEDTLMIHDTHYKSSIHNDLKIFLKQLSINFYIFNSTSLFSADEKYFPTDTCLPFSLKIFLTVHNKLLPCERINHKYFLGEVNENVLIDIKSITQRYNFYYDCLKKVCQYCYAYRFCGVCLFRIKDLDKLDAKEFICDRFYDQKAFENKLYDIFSFLEKYSGDFFHALEN